jgi:hypothetical protein
MGRNRTRRNAQAHGLQSSLAHLGRDLIVGPSGCTAGRRVGTRNCATALPVSQAGGGQGAEPGKAQRQYENEGRRRALGRARRGQSREADCFERCSSYPCEVRSPSVLLAAGLIACREGGGPGRGGSAEHGPEGEGAL